MRSFNNRRGPGAKLVITVFARDIAPCDEPYDRNLILLSGTLCKPPKYRRTPLGPDICDLMLAVNRHYGRSDYLPCITWGARACETALWDVGTRVSLEGRLQSRSYIKVLDTGAIERTATSAACRRRTTERTYRPGKARPADFSVGRGSFRPFDHPASAGTSTSKSCTLPSAAVPCPRRT